MDQLILKFLVNNKTCDLIHIVNDPSKTVMHGPIIIFWTLFRNVRENGGTGTSSYSD